MPKQQKTKGEKQIKKSTSKKKDQKPAKKEEEIEENLPKVKSPPVKSQSTSVKKNVAKEGKAKVQTAQQSGRQTSAKKKKLTTIGKKRVPKKFSESQDSKQEVTEEELKEGKNSKKTKSISKSKSRSRSRSKSQSETSQKVSTPTGSHKSTPSKESGETSSKHRRREAISSGRISEPSYKPPKRPVKGKRGVSPSPPGGKKIEASKVKESSSNIESSSSIDLSAEQKKRAGSEKMRAIKSSKERITPESERIHAEVENVIKKIEDKKRIRKGGEKLLDKKRKRDSTALVIHTAKDFDYILQKNPNVKSKPFINLEELSKHPSINYSDILLALLEVGKNAESYLFPFSSKSKVFWADIMEYTVLKKIFVDFKAETLRKYWNELSKYDAEDTTALIKKNKSYLDNLPIKLGTIVSSITKLLSGKIKDLKEYIEAIKIDIRKKEIFEKEVENPKTGEKVRVKETKITYQPRKRYEPGNVKDFKGTAMNIISLKEVYHQNPNQSEFQKVMTNLKNEDNIKYTYLNEKVEEDKRKINTINEEDKFVFKAIDNVVDALSAEFKSFSAEFILETLRQNSMDIAKTYICLKEPMKSKIIGFTALDDMVLKKKTGEEYKILLKEKGKEAIQEREEFLNN